MTRIPKLQAQGLWHASPGPRPGEAEKIVKPGKGDTHGLPHFVPPLQG